MTDYASTEERDKHLARLINSVRGFKTMVPYDGGYWPYGQPPAKALQPTKRQRRATRKAARTRQRAARRRQR